MNERCVITGRVCWPTGLTAPATGPHASRLVCQHPEHQETAARWVESATGHPGVFEAVPADE